MKHFLYIDTSKTSNETMLAIIECLAGIYGKNLGTLDVSLFDIESTRKRFPLFVFIFDRSSLTKGGLFSWSDLDEYGKEGFKIHQCVDWRGFMHELVTTFKYFKFSGE